MMKIVLDLDNKEVLRDIVKGYLMLKGLEDMVSKISCNTDGIDVTEFGNKERYINKINIVVKD